PTLSLPSPPPTPLVTLSLHDALPISPQHWQRVATILALRGWLVDLPDVVEVEDDLRARPVVRQVVEGRQQDRFFVRGAFERLPQIGRATSELQSPYDLVCRLLLEKKK